MRRLSFCLFGLMLWVSAGVTRAQINISWELENTRTVLMEPVIATVRISNYTGVPLDLSPDGNTRLAFDVEDQPTSPVPTTGKPLIRESLIIPSGETRAVVVNLLDSYRILYGQSYMLLPFVEFDGMRIFAKQRLSLEVQPGLELLQRDYGLRSAGTARSVSFRLIHRNRTDHLFFRLDNSETGFCLGVYDLGPVIRFFNPQLEVDVNGVFHTFHQSAPDRFRYSAFDYDGTPVNLMYYTGDVGSTRMVRNAEGEVSVIGGTAYVEDAAHPGMLVAPAVAPSRPYEFIMGEFQKKGRKPSKDNRGTKITPPPKEKRGTKVD